MKQLVVNQIYKRKQIIKFLIAGGTATLVNFATLFFLVDICHIWYLFSSGMAFLVSFFVSFYLQKFWTFRNKERDIMYKQMTMYMATAVFGLVSNLLFMYILVDFFHWWYMLAQFAIAAVIAVFNYIIYNFIIFKNINNLESE